MSKDANSKLVLVVDDEKDIVDLICYNLKKEGYQTIEASNGAEALQQAKKYKPALILLDIMMPEMDGYDVCRAIRGDKEVETIPIIFLTAKSSEIDEVLGLELGADDYIQKPISPRLLTARIKTHIRRNAPQTITETVKAPEILRVEGLEINRQNYSVRVNGLETFFPKKEFELLAYLASNRGKVFDRDTLLRRIWGESVYVVDRTVDVHISKIRDKLAEYGPYIETVKGVGYRFKE